MLRRPVRTTTVVLALLLAGCASSGQEAEPRPTPTAVTAAEDPAASPTPAASPAPRAPRLALTPARPAPTAAALGQRLLAAEQLLREPGGDRLARANAAFETQVLYRQLARRPAWRPGVLKALGPLRPVAAAHVRARVAFRSMHRHLSGTLPAWRIVAPAPAADLLAFYRKGERRFGVPWQVLAAVNLVETGMGRIRGTSVAGARGPMQFMPATWKAFGKGDIDDPHDAILAAARYLAHNGGGRGRIDNALYRYNNHPAYVRGVKAYAEILRRQPHMFDTLYDWQVVYLSRRGDVWLPEGYLQRRSVPVRAYLRQHPERLLSPATR